VNATLYLDRGNVHYRAGELHEAEFDIRHALELSPNWALARYALTLVFIRSNDYASALSIADIKGRWRPISGTRADGYTLKWSLRRSWRRQRFSRQPAPDIDSTRDGPTSP
jgi:tetratricopeptide (TPR) repeat protein